ncbi:MAG: phosphatase PAP2 family protein [Candidatus Krumholzibacteriia bacterium]
MIVALVLVVVVALSLLWPLPGRTPGAARPRGSLPIRDTGPYWRRMYSRRSFLRLGGALAGAGALAYSGLDEDLETWHARRRGPGSDVVARAAKLQGERFWFLAWATATALDAGWRSSAFTRWGRKNFEAMLVGLPTLWTLQYGLGSARPDHEGASPRWTPLEGHYAASGHTFMAAVPWLNLARRLGHPSARATAGVLSTVTGWSRLNDRSHYPSQVLLGWMVAWNATGSASENVSGPPLA